ncbi:MAG: nuclear transport factor 2 family protein [Pseudomonadota bacterium]|nr:nuclear transport factor 2 family protein [Pseudomonadota bacterium]
MSEREAVLFANDAFYLCFAGEDVDSMDGLWASNAPVTCIHPGWEALYGREEVLESWRSIIAGGSPNIRCREPEVAIYGDFANVICYEEMDGGYLIATNTFVREAGQWKMVHHQAGPTRGKPAEEDAVGSVSAIN